MAQMQSFKRIIIEDFPEDQRDLVSKLASAINPAFEDVNQALNRNLTITDNFSASMKTITVTVNGSGVPTSNTEILSGLGVLCGGIQVIRAVNNTTPANYPTSAPFISFTNNGYLVKLTHVTGLQANEKYTLTLIFWPTK